jgi:hypothetical protein
LDMNYLHFTHISVELLDLTMFFQNKNFIFYILPTSCRIPSCFSEKKIMFYILPTSCRIPSCFSE